MAGERIQKGNRAADGTFAPDLYRSPRGRMVPASGRNEDERREMRNLLIGLVNTPIEGRTRREVNAMLVIGEALAMEVEEDIAQLDKERGARERKEKRNRTRASKRRKV
jgi:hypothetical protein